MRFSEAFLRHLKERVSIGDYAGKLVQWDKRKSQPARGDFWAPCPFHSEKTASFHVREALGAYKCFGCGESGGVLDLAMKLEGLSFPEAVERLAHFAGLALPEEDSPRDDEEERRRKRLLGALDRAQSHFRDMLETSAGREARVYLERRGLTSSVCEQFGIGYAPGGWTTTFDKLKGAGFAPEELISAGLASAPEADRRTIDVFRDRIMFPIGDAQGRIIAFGGRALDPEAKAKYLNSPETALFHKGRTLYRLKEARALLARTRAKGLAIGEGYLDVIAFERAGIAAAAPLGTALTEEQLGLIWRAGGEPIFCFDGDGAGRRAADRVLDLALAQFGPGRTLSVALMPEGQDPDDVFRASGPLALAKLLETARPAADALFERERTREPLDTPERKSSFKKRLRDAAGRIADEETKKLYLSELLSRADAVVRPAWTPGRGQRAAGKFTRGRFEPEPRATPELKARQAGGKRHLALEKLLRRAADQPRLIEQFGDWLARLPLPDADLAVIRDALLDLADARNGQTVDREALSRHLRSQGEERALARVASWPLPGPKPASQEDEAAIEAEWVALVTLDVVSPAMKEELAAYRAADLDHDTEAFERAWRIGSDAIEDQKRRRRRDEPEPVDPASDDEAA